MGQYMSDHRFLFASLDSRKPLTSRKVHIRRLYDVLQLSIHCNNLARARRVWCILARCKEVHWMTMWTTGLHLLDVGLADEDRTPKRLEYLRTMMLRNPENREDIIKELVLHLILAGSYREALEELELYLPSFPYQDNPVLHTYAGLISLYLAQPSSAGAATTFNFEPSLLRDAQSHLERSLVLDPKNVVALAFLEKIANFTNNLSNPDPGSDDGMDLDGDTFRRKRVRSGS